MLTNARQDVLAGGWVVGAVVEAFHGQVVFGLESRCERATAVEGRARCETTVGPLRSPDVSLPVAAAAASTINFSARAEARLEEYWPITRRSRSSEKRRMMRSFSKDVPPLKTISPGWATLIA